jgi:hypothetical protein
MAESSRATSEQQLQTLDYPVFAAAHDKWLKPYLNLGAEGLWA